MIWEEESERSRMSQCCVCGVQMEPNAFNTCIKCLHSEIDISEGIPKHCYLQQCNKCERYLQPPSTWVAAEPESGRLLGLCLKKLPGIHKSHVVDVKFIFTEPHSKRLKVQITMQKEIMEKGKIQQTFVVEYVILNQLCQDCHRFEAKDYWKSCVQVRQKIDHKKTFFYLEQLILKSNLHSTANRIKPCSSGVDFFFGSLQDAKKMVEFISSVVPCRCESSKSLISHDTHSNTYNYKYVFSVEIVPVCKDSIVCLPRTVCNKFGNIGPICLCYRVTQKLYFIDPVKMRTACMSATDYFRKPFLPFCTQKQMKKFLVMDVEKHDNNHENKSFPNKWVHADVWLMEDDISSDTQQIHCRTHLGNLLEAGNYVLAYSLQDMNYNDYNLSELKSEDIPDVIIVKKLYSDRAKRHKKRKWMLKRMGGASQVSTTEDDYQDFLEDLEEDPEIRGAINIYKDPTKLKSGVEPKIDDNSDDDYPAPALSEMLEDLHITDEMEVE